MAFNPTFFNNEHITESSDNFGPISLHSAGKRRKTFGDDFDRVLRDSGKEIPEDEQELDQCESESKDNEDKAKDQPISTEWTEKEDIDLFKMYKQKGSKWAVIVKSFKGKTKDSIRNRFYSTLRRIARHKAKLDPNAISKNLLEYVDDAIKYGHTCFCKRGRPKKASGKPVEVTEEKQESLPKQTTPPSTTSCPPPNPPSFLELGGEQEEGIERSKTLEPISLNRAIVNLIISQQTLINELLGRKMAQQGQKNIGLI